MNKLLSMLGLSARAGRLVSGVQAVEIALKKSEAKIVVLDADVSESTKNGIMLDNAEVGATAARLFLRRGYCNFAYIGNNAEQESFHSGIRREAFAGTAAADGFECASHSFNGKYSGRELSRLSKFLMAQPKPCAVLAYSDNIAKFVYDACNLANLSIPDQIGVIGVDNETSICETLRPPLTSILPDFEACGYIAAEALMRKILAQDSPPDLGNSLYGVRTVFERESSMDIDGSARLVSRAREYIATHYPESLAVKAIAGHLGTCRRRLELKFRKVTGGTVHDEIKRVRLDCAKRLLSNTNLTVGEISAAAGYGTEAAFRAAFAKAERMSPRQFRCRRRP